jgi:hypothetical protein
MAFILLHLISDTVYTARLHYRPILNSQPKGIAALSEAFQLNLASDSSLIGWECKHRPIRRLHYRLQ